MYIHRKRRNNNLFKEHLKVNFYKVVRFFGLKLKISTTSEPIRFSSFGKLHIDPVMVKAFFISSIFLAPSTPSNKKPLDAMGVAASFFLNSNVVF